MQMATIRQYKTSTNDKKRLAGNQTLIAYLRKVKAFDDFVVKPSLTAKTAGKSIQSNRRKCKTNKKQKSIQFLFEVIRREPDWKKN